MISPNMNQSLSDIFNVELTSTDKTVDELKIDAKVADINSLEARRDYVRQNLVEVIEKSKTMLTNITNIANSTEQAKDFDVANKIIETLVNTNMTLLECEVIHKQKETPALPSPTGAPSTVTNNTVFVGSTSDLSTYIKKMSSGIDSAIDVKTVDK
jgi:hypothetical protein